MTEGCIPPAAVGKSTDNVGNAGQSSTQGGTGGGCGISFNPAAWYGASAEVIAAENDRRKADNADRARRRASGDDTDDELLLDDDGLERPGLSGSGIAPPTPPSPPGQTQLSGALQGLSPTRQQAVLKAIESLKKQAHTPTPPYTSTRSNGGSSTSMPAVDDKSLSSSIECPDDFFQDQGLELPPAIVKLGLARIHVPLTLTTSSAIRKILNDPASLKMKKVVTITGQKLDLLDLSEWPEETSLPQERFFEAWQNMLKLYARIGDEVVTNRFQAHFNYLLALPDFADDYKAILRFDCEVRRTYMNKPGRFSPTDTQYQNRLNAIKLRVMSEENKAARQPQGDISRRFSPYPQGGRGDNRARPGDDSFRPFRDGRRPTSSEPTCLVCARTGHHASKCTHTSTKDGRPTIAIYKDRRLIIVTSRQELCVLWNVSGNCVTKRCPKGSNHTCSFCGSRDHHAGSLQCVRA